jgi:hypothetical protein
VTAKPFQDEKSLEPTSNNLLSSGRRGASNSKARPVIDQENKIPEKKNSQSKTPFGFPLDKYKFSQKKFIIDNKGPIEFEKKAKSEKYVPPKQTEEESRPSNI